MELSPVARVASLSKAEFRAQHGAPHRPVVLERLTEAWPAREKWTLDYLRQVAGEAEVPLYDGVIRPRAHQYAHAGRLRLADYIGRLEAGEKDLRIFSLNVFGALPALAKDFSFPDIGLPLFRKIAFLFAGGAGAKVPMHYDIDLPDLLLCHFGGRKRVMLFAPDQSRAMYRVPFSFSTLRDVDFDRPDYARFPALRRLEGQTAILDHGDVLYIPSGWWHYVVYEEAGLSMSLRAFPRAPRDILRMLNNLLVVRSVESLMRRTFGEKWRERNERRAVRNATMQGTFSRN